jgi:hypothetical protein
MTPRQRLLTTLGALAFGAAAAHLPTAAQAQAADCTEIAQLTDIAELRAIASLGGSCGSAALTRLLVLSNAPGTPGIVGAAYGQ